MPASPTTFDRPWMGAASYNRPWMPTVASGSLASGPVSGYNPAFGGVPTVPNPTATQSGALAGNLSNMGSIAELTNLINSLNEGAADSQSRRNREQAQWQANLDQELATWTNTLNQNIADVNNTRSLDFEQQLNAINQQIAQQNNQAAIAAAREADLLNMEMTRRNLERYVPGLSGLEEASSRNIASELAGQVSPGTINLLAQQAAERGAGRGFGVDSPGTNAALMAALGLTAEQQAALGQQHLTGAMGRTPNLSLASAPISTAPYSSVSPVTSPFANAPVVTAPYAQAQQFNPASMLIDPNSMQAWQYFANLLGSAPNPTAAAMANMNALANAANYGRQATAPATMTGSTLAGPSVDPRSLWQPTGNFTAPYAGSAGAGQGVQPYGGEDWQWNDYLGGYMNVYTGAMDYGDQTATATPYEGDINWDPYEYYA